MEVSNNINNFKILKNNIDKWASDKGIHDKGSCFSQLSKTHEEVLELVTAFNNSDFEETKDAIGDILVTLINASWFVPDYDINDTYNEVMRKREEYGNYYDPLYFSTNFIRIFDALGFLFARLLDISSNEKTLEEDFNWTFKSQVHHIITALNNMVHSDRMLGLTLENCLQSAYEVISKRKGKMDPNTGIFIKENS